MLLVKDCHHTTETEILEIVKTTYSKDEKLMNELLQNALTWETGKPRFPKGKRITKVLNTCPVFELPSKAVEDLVELCSLKTGEKVLRAVWDDKRKREQFVKLFLNETLLNLDNDKVEVVSPLVLVQLCKQTKTSEARARVIVDALGKKHCYEAIARTQNTPKNAAS